MRRNAVSLWVGLLCVIPLGGTAVVRASPEESSPAKATASAEKQNKAIVRRWIEEGFNKKKLQVVGELFAEGAVVNGQLVGAEGVRRSMSGFLGAFPDLQVTITEALAEGERVGVWYTVRATHKGVFQGIPPTEKEVTWSGVDLFRVAGGRIVEARFLDDSLGLLRQLGAVPARP